jgi:hypothetical protein
MNRAVVGLFGFAVEHLACVLLFVLPMRNQANTDTDQPALQRDPDEWKTGDEPMTDALRPHSALGPGLPDKPTGRATLTCHSLSPVHRVVASTRLGGLHHHYRLQASPPELLRSTAVFVCS